ncbi:hypothetical protein [Palleronia sp.]|uniref:hypothetical protein n=1 Tax=Palleronia sp. TaxID=1940284 RepID=UPI0035C7F59B
MTDRLKQALEILRSSPDEHSLHAAIELIEEETGDRRTFVHEYSLSFFVYSYESNPENISKESIAKGLKNTLDDLKFDNVEIAGVCSYVGVSPSLSNQLPD